MEGVIVDAAEMMEDEEGALRVRGYEIVSVDELEGVAEFVWLADLTIGPVGVTDIPLLTTT